jgi:nitrite reductase (NADH) small subunit
MSCRAPFRLRRLMAPLFPQPSVSEGRRRGGTPAGDPIGYAWTPARQPLSCGPIWITTEKMRSMPESSLVKVGPVDSFPVDAMRIVTVAGREVGIVRRADSTVHAVRNRCPHKGAQICKGPITGTMLPGEPGTLTWAMEGEILRCPWHGFEFELATGKRPFTDSRMHLRIYPARIDGGEIVLDMGPQR